MLLLKFSIEKEYRANNAVEIIRHLSQMCNLATKDPLFFF
jgi:hypothetical protein